MPFTVRALMLQLAARGALAGDRGIMGVPARQSPDHSPMRDPSLLSTRIMTNNQVAVV